MTYVDGFVIPVPKKNLAKYKKIASVACKVWMEHGALQYIEAVGDDMKTNQTVPFPKLAGTKAGETVVFSYIVFKSRAHRDKVNAKVMQDKRILNMMSESTEPFDCKRMAYGGFKTFVSSK